MIRPAVALLLLLTAILMMRGVAGDWRRTTLIPSEAKAKKAAAAPSEPTPLPPAKDLRPSVPAVLPDLKTGYLFNQERTLASPEAAPSGPSPEVGAETQPGIGANVDQVTYTGSILANGFKRALVVFPSPKAAAAQHAAPRPGAAGKGKAGKIPAPAQGADAGAPEHALLSVGEMIGGYEVKEILPTKLVLAKGDEEVEKPLFDPNKKRQPPPPKPPAAGPPRPPGQVVGGSHPSPPGQVSGQPVGAGGQVAPAPMPAEGNAQPAVPVPPSPTPASPAATTTPAPTPTAAGTGTAATGTPQLPIRRMVISRQAAPSPDTSRVNRQAQGGEGGAAVPLSPTSIPGAAGQ